MAKNKKKMTALEKANKKRAFWKTVAGIGSVAVVVISIGVSIATGGKVNLKS